MKKAMKVRGIHAVGPCKASRAIVGFVLLGLAASQCWAYSGGQGTLQVPYGLSSPEDLIQLSLSLGDYDKHFVLMADIDLAGHTFDQAVIAPTDAPSVSFFDTEGVFTGTIDGNGHVVSNLTITGGSYLGLVGVLKSPGQILGLGVVDADVVGTGRSIGILVGHNEGHIRQCFAFGSVVGESEIGGLGGRNEGKIENCFAGGSVSGLDSVGGLMGRSRMVGGLSNSYSTPSSRGCRASRLNPYSCLGLQSVKLLTFLSASDLLQVYGMWMSSSIEESSMVKIILARRINSF